MRDGRHKVIHKLVDQELFALPEHLTTTPPQFSFCRIRVAQFYFSV